MADDGVHGAPYEAAFGLLSWGEQHWPWVRGRCLVDSGTRLETLPLSDMCDILHYYFEDDILVEESVGQAKTQLRGRIYNKLYLRPYTWGVNEQPEKEFGTQEVGSNGFRDQPVLEHKGYVPPTPFDPTSKRPYGMLLDPPLE